MIAIREHHLGEKKGGEVLCNNLHVLIILTPHLVHIVNGDVRVGFS